MAQIDWYNLNANRSYPFVSNPDCKKLKTDEILDGRFYILNPVTVNPKVYLYSRTKQGTSVRYVFRAKDGDNLRSIAFISSPHSEPVCIWNTDNPDFYGFISVR